MRKFYIALIALLMGAMSICAGPVFINEIHYDNTGSDVNEGVEIAGPSGTNLNGWSLYLYNGNGGGVYGMVNLSGFIPQSTSGIGTVFFLFDGLQNGPSDGIALVNSSNSVVEFLSYEGTIMAVGGPAAGLTSIDIGVDELSSTEFGQSLQLAGTGNVSTDFTWQSPLASSYGVVNVNQAFTGSATDLAPSVFETIPTNAAASVSVDSDIVVTFTEPVDVTGQWFSIDGSLSGTVPGQVTGGPMVFTLNPSIDFEEGETITATIFSDMVEDIDGDPDSMAGDFLWSFLVFDSSQSGLDPIPAGYYSTAEGKTSSTLADALHDIIDDHTIISFDQADEAFQTLDRDPFQPGNVVLIYSGVSASSGGFSGQWNREHLWPRSRGIDDTGPDTSDLFSLRPSIPSINSSRGNLIFDQSDPEDSGYRPPGTFVLAPEVSRDNNSWEPPDRVKGEIARAMFYMAVRYDGSDSSTKDLVLNNDPQFVSGSFIPEMGILDTLLAWNREHPVTDAERLRNQLIFNDFQENRNPFIDFPEFADAFYTADQFITNGSWKVTHFSLNEILDDEISGMEADPDSDGVKNFLELAFNMNPRAPDREHLPKLTSNESGIPIFSYRRLSQPEEAGLEYTLQYTDDLSIAGGGWVSLDLQQVAVVETPQGMITAIVVEDTSFDPGATAARFYRLVVE